MNRRDAVIGLVVLAVVPCTVGAQQAGRLPTIGFLDIFTPSGGKPNREAFEQALRERGWKEGKTVVTEYRSTAGNPELYAKLAAELVRLNVDVIVTGGEGLIRAAQQATSSIPIVMTTVIDPVGSGFVKSLARPGGNLTGMATLGVGLAGKWLELLKEAVPRIKRVAVLRNSTTSMSEKLWHDAEASAAKLGIGVVSIGYQSPADLDDAFARIVTHKAAAVLVLPDPIAGAHSARIAQIALRNNLPSLYLFRDYVALGGLMSYGPNRPDNYRRAAEYVDRILRGAKPADLPVQQPTQFEMAINLKTAKAFGLVIPRSVLLRADEVIQ